MLPGLAWEAEGHASLLGRRPSMGPRRDAHAHGDAVLVGGEVHFALDARCYFKEEGAEGLPQEFGEGLDRVVAGAHGELEGEHALRVHDAVYVDGATIGDLAEEGGELQHGLPDDAVLVRGEHDVPHAAGVGADPAVHQALLLEGMIERADPVVAVEPALGAYFDPVDPLLDD